MALWRDADGRHKKRLGPAHVKDSGRRTARGAKVWRAGDGPKPDASYLTPKEAADRLAELLAAAPREISPGMQVTFGDACADWLRYIEHERSGPTPRCATTETPSAAISCRTSGPTRPSVGSPPTRSTRSAS